MCAQSKPHAAMIGPIAQLKVPHGLKIAVVSNEGRDLNTYWIRKFKVLYIENTPMFVQIAEGLGIRSILHTVRVCETSFAWPG